MHLLISLILLGIFSFQLAWATQETYTTSTGARFSKVFQPNFHYNGAGMVWQDSSGRVWSSILWKDNYWSSMISNEALAPEESSRIVKSPATEACAEIGGQLPSADDYQELISNFEVNASGLTAAGKKDFDFLFPDMGHRSFWTSTTVTEHKEIAWWFYGGDGRVVYEGKNPNRHKLAYVRCIVQK